MGVSIYLAKFIGVYLLIISLLWVVRFRAMKASFEAMISNRSVVSFSGIIATVLGSAIVVAHNVWTPDFRVVITLLGYLSLYQGIMRLGFTDSCMRTFSRLQETKGSYVLLALSYVIGLWLCYEGFVR